MHCKNREHNNLCTKFDPKNGWDWCYNIIWKQIEKKHFQECTLNAEEAKYKNGCVNWNQYYTKCTTGPTNPFNGAISFDNIGLAWVAIFLVISLEGWTDVMYFVQVWLLTKLARSLLAILSAGDWHFTSGCSFLLELDLLCHAYCHWLLLHD